MVVLQQGDDALPKIKVYNLASEKIQPKKTINARTGRKRMSQDREVAALLSDCIYSSDIDTWSVFNATSCRNLHAFRC